VANAADNFNRASLGSNWTISLGGAAINASTDVKGTGAADNVIWWNADSFQGDHSSQVDLSNADAANDGGPVTRHQSGSASFYLYDVSATGGGIYRCSAGSFTLLGAVLGTPAGQTAGHAYKLVSTGSSHEAFNNGTSVGVRPDATHLGGSPGIHCFAATIRWDNWVGGPLTVPPPASARPRYDFFPKAFMRRPGLAPDVAT
jgi:hypothetical protein